MLNEKSIKKLFIIFYQNVFFGGVHPIVLNSTYGLCMYMYLILFNYMKIY